MSFREYCMAWHRISVRRGYFLAARHMLRSALNFREHGRENSIAVEYFFSGGKLDWFQYGN